MIQEDAEIAHFDPMFTLDSQSVKRLATAPRKSAPLPGNSDTAGIAKPMASIAPATPFLL